MAATCGICQKEDLKYVPVEWCPECQKALCSSCSQHHNQDKSSKDHETIPHDNFLKLPPFIKHIDQNCPEHNERYQYLCREHDQLICNRCLKTQHTTCKETPILNDIVKKVKSSNAFQDVTHEMKETFAILQNGIKGQQRNLKQMHNQKKEMARNVEDTIARATAHLMKVKQNMLSDIDAIVTKKENETRVTIQKLQSMEKQIGEIYDQKDSIKLYATNLETFIGIKEMEKVVEESKTSLTELSDGGALDHATITLDRTNIETLLTIDKLFGDIKVTKIPNNLSIETSKPKQAQIMSHAIPEQLKLQQEIRLEHGVHWGCCTLPSGLLVIADNGHNKLKLINPDGTTKSIIRFEERPYDVTAVDKNHVAVSHPGDKLISIVDMSVEKITKTLSTKNEVRGISNFDCHIIFCVPESGIKRLNINTEKIDNIINDDTVSPNSQVVAGSNRICYTCPYSSETVTVLDSQYNVMFKYQDKSVLEFPLGVSLDIHNNVYVAGYLTCNLLVISPDGKKVKQLLSQGEGLYHPSAVYYCHHTKQLIVVVNEDFNVHKFSLG